MLPLDVPVTSDHQYAEFLTRHKDRVQSVHYSLNDPALKDARQCLMPGERKALYAALKLLPHTAKFVLMNTRLHAPDTYFNDNRLAATAQALDELTSYDLATGVIFADPYFLHALSDTHQETATRLEAIPSVNAMLDSPQRVFAMLDMIQRTHFKPPSRLVLDRALNRDIPALDACVTAIRREYPDLKIYLMANEGCLYHCPYKPAHDAHIAMVNERLCNERTHAINRNFGCIRHFLSTPAAFLTSPFIRPEDTRHYSDLIDGIKLCGRNRGTSFLQRLISAYLDEQYAGNLLDLMDAMGDLADQITIPTSLLPDDFHQQVTRCDKRCARCGWCAELARTIIQKRTPTIDRFPNAL